MSSVPPITPGTPMQPPKRFLPALVTASDRAAGNLVGGVNMDATPSQVQAFEDYKRKHSKQNRDIIKTNAERAFRIRALEDENTALQIEVLNIRQEKAEVADQLRKEKERLDRFKENHQVKEALDALLLAIPQIHQLRALVSSPSSSSSRRSNNGSSSSSSSPSNRKTGTTARTRSRGLEPPVKKLEIQTWLNRPAIVKAGKPTLENLIERNETGDELRCVEEMVLDAHAGLASRPTSGIHKVSEKPRSTGRRQSGLFRPISETPMVKDSGLTPASTSSAKASPRKSPRKRALRPAEDEVPTPLSPVRNAKLVEPSEKHVPSLTLANRQISSGPTSKEVTQGKVDTEPETERDSTERVEKVLKDMTPLKNPSMTGQRAQPRIVSQTADLSSTKAGKAVETFLKVDNGDKALPLEGPAEDEQELGGRQRRVRKSVNYKEPNLHVKMRKPDPDPNQVKTTAPLTTPGRKSAGSGTLGTPISASLRGEIGAQPSSTTTTTATSASGVMRRKSVLPSKSRRHEAGDEVQNEKVTSDVELPETGSPAEKLSSRRRSRFGTPLDSTNVDSPYRPPLKSIDNINSTQPPAAAVASATRVRRRSTLFQQHVGGA